MVTHRSSQTAIGPLLGELPRASEDDRHFRVADGQPAQHVRQPGTPARLSAEEVRIVSLHHHGSAGQLGQPLRLEGEAAIGERGGQVLQRLALDDSDQDARDNGAVIARRSAIRSMDSGRPANFQPYFSRVSTTSTRSGAARPLGIRAPGLAAWAVFCVCHQIAGRPPA